MRRSTALFCVITMLAFTACSGTPTETPLPTTAASANSTTTVITESTSTSEDETVSTTSSAATTVSSVDTTVTVQQTTQTNEPTEEAAVTTTTASTTAATTTNTTTAATTATAVATTAATTITTSTAATTTTAASTTTVATTTAATTTTAQTTTTNPSEADDRPAPGADGENWVAAEPPVFRTLISESEKLARRLEILGQGTLLFSGNTDSGYYPSDISWLQNAKKTDALVLVFACDDVTHGGWGVVGIGAGVNGNYMTLQDVKAYSDQPDRERVEIYTLASLMKTAGISDPKKFESFSAGAWNGGRIKGLYLVSDSVLKQLDNYNAEVEHTEQITHSYTGDLSNKYAIDSAVEVYEYLKSVYGDYCLTGQMESTWMGSPDYEMNYIKDATGKLPAIRGLDFMGNDFAGVTKRAKEWWELGGIPTICWHTGAGFDTGYTECLADNINWDEAFVRGSATYNALIKGMDRAVPYLQELEDAGVPILWRPFHELDGGWFWWSKGGSDNFVKLWQLMYSRYTDYWQLDNLIWVYGYSSSGADVAAWYPGDSYVDLIGADSYDPGANGVLFDKIEEVAADGMPIVFHECGTIPTAQQLSSANADWSFFMTWHTDWLTDTSKNNRATLKEIYNGSYFITLDELPDFG